MKSFIGLMGTTLLAASLLAACGSGNAGKNTAALDGATGTIKSKLSLPQGSSHDVVRVRFKVVAAGGTCSDAAIAETTTSLEEEGLIPSLTGGGSGALRPFADGLIVLPPGDYLVCATPLKADDRPSAECATASGNITVVPEKTTEIILASQCDGVPNGGSDTILTFNDPPKITDLKIGPSKFIGQCEKATLTVTASDPNSDQLTYAWEVVSGPASSALTSNGNTATFTPGGAGSYEAKVTVTDIYGSKTELSFPIHVAADTCKNTCPTGTVAAAGLCWAPTILDANELPLSASANCARFGLKMSDEPVAGLKWTSALFQEVKTALGCTEVTREACCDPTLFVDSTSNECYASGVDAENPADYTNSLFDNGPNNLPVHACQNVKL